jgi:hypothetical protein
MRYLVIAFHSPADNGNANDQRASILPTVRISDPARVKTVSEPIRITTDDNATGREIK